MKYHISTKLLVSFISLVILSIVLFGLITYSFTYNVLLEKNIHISQAALSKLSLSVDDEIAEIDNISKVFVTSSETIDLVNTEEQNTNRYYSDQYYSYVNLDSLTKTFITLKPNVESVLISDSSGKNYSFGFNNYVAANYRIQDEEWFPGFWYGNQLSRILSPQENPHDFNYPVMAVVRKIRILYSSENIGTVKINFKIDPLIRLVDSSTPDSSYLCITDRGDNLIYTTLEGIRDGSSALASLISGKESPYLRMSLNGDSYYVIYEQAPYSRLTYSLLIPQKELMGHLPALVQNMLVSAVFCLLIGGLVSLLIAKPFIRSIRTLADGMNQIEGGNIDCRVKKTTDDEIGYLTTQFNAMADNIQRLIHINGEMKSKSILQEMKVLQSQITPHFLFNTLESIRMKALSNQPDSVSYIVEELGELLRFNLRNPHDLVTLERELFYIRKYINLHNSRLHQPIHIRFPDLKEYGSLPIPKFILQPLVENAIIHGLELQKSDRSILIDLKREEGTLWISIEDNGVGMPEALVEELNQAFQKNAPDYNSHIGLTNINNRLKLHYGEECGLSLVSFEHQGTTVLLKITVEPNL